MNKDLNDEDVYDLYKRLSSLVAIKAEGFEMRGLKPSDVGYVVVCSCSALLASALNGIQSRVDRAACFNDAFEFIADLISKDEEESE